MKKINNSGSSFKIAFLTLGCDKNVVDSEYFAGMLKEKGIQVFDINQTADFNILVINTCSFIHDAREESINSILKWVEIKKKKKNHFKIIVIGCLPQRYGEQLKKEIPEIDLMLGVGNWEDSANKILGLIANSSKKIEAKKDADANRICGDFMSSPDLTVKKNLPRFTLSKQPYSFLKIADGCSHKCSFCAIPKIKGRYYSFPKEQILGEAKALVGQGIKELNIIAQDTTAYGMDVGNNYDLSDLLGDISSIPGDFKIRILYAYPSGISDRLIKTIKENPKIIKYLDIPLQHLDSEILKKMKRPFKAEHVFKTIKKLRSEIEGIVLRTTFIVGFPGEDEKAFNNLMDGIKEIKFERAGVFTYSPEEDTEAIAFDGKIPQKIKNKRRNTLLKAQAKITGQFQKSFVGREIEILLEQITNNPKVYYGRGYMDAPDVDGGALIISEKSIPIGEYIKVKITSADIYDLIGEPVFEQF